MQTAGAQALGWTSGTSDDIPCKRRHLKKYVYNIIGYITNKSSGLPLDGVTVGTNTSQTTKQRMKRAIIALLFQMETYIINATKYSYNTNTTQSPFMVLMSLMLISLYHRINLSVIGLC